MTVHGSLQALNAHRERVETISMREMFATDPARFEKFSLSLGDLLFDYSKNRIDIDIMAALGDLARLADVEGRRDAMFEGRRINTTENRAVLHTALRAPANVKLVVDGEDIIEQVQAVLAAMRLFADGVRGGGYRVTGGAVADVVNIGIGGSDLGPAMAARALAPYCDGPRVHFVSNVDAADLIDTLKGLDPATTLFIVASKTFTTAETMTNAASARAWVESAVGADEAAKHFAALSTNLAATAAFGIPPERTFGFWEWVGGRYSIWSAIGLSLMIAIGPDRFGEFLAGGHAVDTHFREAPLEKNIPVVMALLGVWHRNIWGFATQAVLPYDDRLARFAAYLQQLEMESNGKGVAIDGGPLAMQTGPVIWGEPGTNGQHAFYQLIHQGTEIIPCDFLLAAQTHDDAGFPSADDHHIMLAANCLAQSQALMQGKTLDEVRAELAGSGMDEAAIERLAPHKVFPGNRPSSTLLYRKLDAHTLGMLIALYEHKVFVQGVIWDINSFDQWGVELGKVLAREIEPVLRAKTGAPAVGDASTAGLAARFMVQREEK